MDLLCTPLDARFDTREAPTGGGRAAGIAAKAGFVADLAQLSTELRAGLPTGLPRTASATVRHPSKEPSIQGTHDAIGEGQ